MPDFPEFVDTLKKLHLKKKGNRPKVSPQKFYPSQVELQTQELIREELGEYAYRLQAAAMQRGVQGVYDVPGAVPQGFDEKVQKVAEAVSLFQVKAFANFSELTVGERYFPSGGESRDVILNTWSDNFVNLCKSTNEEMRKKVAGVISDGVLGGRNIRDLTKDIQNTCKDFSRSKAELIAVTEVGKLNTAMAKNQSESAGIQFYEWGAAMDGRTRESHAVMDGKICKWGDDDHYYVWETDAKTGKRKMVRKERPANAYKGAPGTDFRCRCVALPYVPEYEDDYVREKGPVQGVKQVANAEKVSNKENELTKKYVEEKRRIDASFAQQKAKMDKMQNKNVERAQIIDPKGKFIDDGEYIKTDKRRKDAASNPKKANEKKKYDREMEMAKVAVLNGYPVVFLNEYNYNGGKNPDAVMDDRIVEFKKNVKKKIRGRFSEGLLQSQNVFMLVEEKISYEDFVNEIKREKYDILKSKNVKKKKEHEEKIKNLANSRVYFTTGDKIYVIEVSKL